MNTKYAFFFIVCLPLLSWANYFKTPAEGWHWNTQLPVVRRKNFQHESSFTPSQQLNALHAYINNVKAQAVLDPTPAHVAHYLVLQQALAEQATQFSRVALSVVKTTPALNYNLQSPTNSETRQLLAKDRLAHQALIAKVLAQHYGLFFFYRGHNPAAVITAQAVKQVAQTYHFALRGIPVDHLALPIIPINLVDQGQSARLGVKATPAVFLVNPQTHDIRLLQYGYPSVNQLLSDMTQTIGEQRHA